MPSGCFRYLRKKYLSAPHPYLPVLLSASLVGRGSIGPNKNQMPETANIHIHVEQTNKACTQSPWVWVAEPTNPTEESYCASNVSLLAVGY